MEMQEKFLLGALLGSAIGAAAALIFTPMSGEKMRQKIIDEIQGSSRQSGRSHRRTLSRHTTSRRPAARSLAAHKSAESSKKTQHNKSESKAPRKTASVGLKVQAQKS